jgi:23S rRNA pseudouridine1911/1915/1917 synthase
MNIEVLFENNHLLVINKPSGLVVHSDGKTDEPTVVDWILEHYPDIQGVGEDMNIGDLIISRPGIVHRIDRDTSGCLVIAKTQESFEHIKQQFKDRKVQKTYQALVYGNIKKDSGEITEPIGKSKKDFRMKMAGRGARGTLRDALTEFAVLKRLEDATSVDKQGQTLKYTLVELKPKTGRTHQLRVHLKYINHPIVSDSLYKGKRDQALGLERTALHAQRIELTDIDGTQVVASAELAGDIKKALEVLQEQAS